MTPRRADRYDLAAPRLAVYLDGRRVGRIGESSTDLWFRYEDSAIDAADPRQSQLSIRLPVVDRTYGHDETVAFFDNLLLESDLRDAIAKASKLDTSDVAGLLGRVGGECAGAVSVWPIELTPPSVDVYRPIALSELEALFVERHGARLTALQLEARQAMSGVQHKLTFAWRKETPLLPLDGAPGSVILKRSTGRYEGLALNEHLCLRLFDAMDLPTAPSDLLHGPSGFLRTQRFDRPVDSDGRIRRVHQEDFCQATGRLPRRKYQIGGEPGFADLGRVLRQVSVSTARDLEMLVRAAFMHIVVGNMDAHAKNYALLYTDRGPQLAPFYDIVCTEVYEQLDRQLSMHVGHARDPERLTHADLRRFAKDLDIGLSLVREQLDRLIEELPPAVDTLWSSLWDSTSPDPIAERMRDLIGRRLLLLQQIR